MCMLHVNIEHLRQQSNESLFEKSFPLRVVFVFIFNQYFNSLMICILIESYPLAAIDRRNRIYSHTLPDIYSS